MHGGIVYALGPRGRLIALGLGSGEQLWARDLVEDFGSRKPEYGYATTPIAEDDVVIVQAGGPDGRSLLGLDARTGDLIWETRVGPDQAPGYGGNRSLSIAGDKIFLYSDGVVEATPETVTEPFGFDRLEASLRRHALSDVEGLRDGVLADLEEHAGRRPREDDLTVLVLGLT